ncbi:MAG: hypothetical protein WAW62_03890 [Candidatus Saccharimonas aalborgensis]
MGFDILAASQAAVADRAAAVVKLAHKCGSIHKVGGFGGKFAHQVLDQVAKLGVDEFDAAVEAAFNTLSSADKARGDLLKTGADAARDALTWAERAVDKQPKK